MITGRAPRSAQPSNHVFKVTAGGRTFVVKIYRPKPRTFKFYKYRALVLLGLPIPVEYRAEAERKRFEREVYACWHERGFPVPQVYETVESHELVPAGITHLILEYIPGPTLEGFLRDTARVGEEKLAVLDQLFRECRQRHERCLQEQDFRLVHFDSNLRNIILRDGTLFHVDFEMGRSNEPLVRSIAREIQKVAVEAGDILGRPFLGPIAALLSREYSATGVTRRIIRDASAHGRIPKSSGRDVGDRVTRFDLARALAQHEAGASSPSCAP